MPGKTGSARTSRPRRVLVVEDQALLSEVIAEGLAPDFEVLCATTVADGVEWLMAAAVDVVLLDCVLPGETMWPAGEARGLRRIRTGNSAAR
jgi:DNA-binding response OmpR family regulator